MRAAGVLAAGLLPAILLGCSGASDKGGGGLSLLGPKSCKDRPSSLGAFVSCDLPDGLEIAQVERRACEDPKPGYETTQLPEVTDGYTFVVAADGKTEAPFARVKVEQSSDPQRYSSHKWLYMENFHVIAGGTVPGKEVLGFKTFWIDEKTAIPGEPETLHVLFADDARAIVSAQFLRREGKERSKKAQDGFVEAYAKCLKGGS